MHAHINATFPLFDAALIDASIIHQVPRGFVLRPLEPNDYDKGMLEVLGHLTTVGTISRSAFLNRFQHWFARNDTYFIVVVEDLTKGRIAGCGTMMLERKLIHQLGMVGHLEDTATLPEYRGKQLGRLIIQGLTSVSRRMGAYKTILDCVDDNIQFYTEKCGFTAKETEMVLYHRENDGALKAKL